MVLMPTRGHATGKRVSCGSGPSNGWRAWLGWTPCRTLAPFPAKATTTGGWRATLSGLRARRHAPSTTCSWRRQGSQACADELIRLESATSSLRPSIQPSAWKVNSPKSVYDILYNHVPVEGGVTSGSPEDRDPNTTCGERT